MIRILLKSGVLGVLGVPESLQASNCAAFSDGTPLQKHENTCVQNTNGVPENDKRCAPLTLPRDLPASKRGQGCTLMSMDDESKNLGGTRRWAQQHNEVSGQLEWAWQPDAPDDLDALFERVDSQKHTALDIDLLDACILDKFISQAGLDGEGAVAPWILKELAIRFLGVLFGSEWNDRFILPGRPTSCYSLLSEKEWRDQDLFYDIKVLMSNEGCNVTDAIRRTAETYCVSYETARAAYYEIKKRMSIVGALLSKI